MMISVIIVIPLTLFLYFATIYLYDFMEADQYPNLYMLFFIIINFICLIPMYRKLAESDLEDEEDPTIWELIKEFLKHFGMVLFISVPLFLIGLIGMSLAFIPTAICGAIMLVFPFAVHYLDIKKMLTATGSILKRENIFILLDLAIVVSAQILIYSLIMQAFANFENSYYVYGITRALVNATVFPLLIFYLTQRYTVELNEQRTEAR